MGLPSPTLVIGDAHAVGGGDEQRHFLLLRGSTIAKPSATVYDGAAHPGAFAHVVGAVEERCRFGGRCDARRIARLEPRHPWRARTGAGGVQVLGAAGRRRRRSRHRGDARSLRACHRLTPPSSASRAGRPSPSCRNTTRCPASAMPAATTSSPPPVTARPSRSPSSARSCRAWCAISARPPRSAMAARS